LKMSKLQLLTFYLCLVLVGTAQAQQNNALEPSEADADFLVFLAEVEAATGDGFEQWIETDSMLFNCNQNKPNIPLDVAKTCQDKQ